MCCACSSDGSAIEGLVEREKQSVARSDRKCLFLQGRSTDRPVGSVDPVGRTVESPVGLVGRSGRRSICFVRRSGRRAVWLVGRSVGLIVNRSVVSVVGRVGQTIRSSGGSVGRSEH